MLAGTLLGAKLSVSNRPGASDPLTHCPALGDHYPGLGDLGHGRVTVSNMSFFTADRWNILMQAFLEHKEMTLWSGRQSVRS